MRLERSLAASGSSHDARRVVTIGAFDGLHLGHQEIFRRARAVTGPEQRFAVLSFEPTPAEFFAASEPPARLTCFREKYEQLIDHEVDELFCPPFSTVSELDHEQFVREVLVRRLNAGHVVIGHDFRYGRRRQGDIETLEQAGRRHGFDVTVVAPVYVNANRVSSTRIREALQRGDLESASEMLGRDYSMSGRVVHGLGLGRDLGFPTANVNLKRRKAPVDGIFAVAVEGVSAAPIAGVASIGSRPTVGGGKTLLEVYIFDFDADIYGTYITVQFKKRLRSEEHFASIDEMKIQMKADVIAAKAALTQ